MLLQELFNERVAGGFSFISVIHTSMLPWQSDGYVGGFISFYWYVGALRKRCSLSPFYCLLCVYRSEKSYKRSNNAGPASLVTRPKARTIIAMEIFEEEDVVTPVWILLEFFRTTIHRARFLLIAGEYSREPVGNFFCHFEKVHHIT